MLFPKYITKTLKTALTEHFPDSTKNESFCNFIMYLSFGTWYDWNSNFLRISQKICAILENKPFNGKYIAQPFLDSMQELLPGLVVDHWTFLNGANQETYQKESHARLVIDSGLSPEWIKIIEQEKKNILSTPKEELVHYITGSIYNRIRSKAAIEEADQTGATQMSAKTAVELQERFLEHFNGLDTHSFTKAIKDNLEQTVKLAETFAFKDESVRDRNFKLLDSIKMQPKPFYYAVEGSRRLYGYGSSIPYLKKELRKELTKGWIEFDIINCHLAIAAKDWNITGLKKLFSQGKTIWNYFTDKGIDVAKAKPILKQFLYSMVYGDSKSNMKALLKKNTNMTNKLIEEFFKLDLIKEIFDAREIELNCALYNTIDCFGQEIKYKSNDPNKPYDRRAQRSILAQKMQAVELKMLEPLIEYSKNNKNMMLVCLYQFDGFSVVCKQPSRIKNHCNVLKKLLDDHIKSLGYDTAFEYKIN